MADETTQAPEETGGGLRRQLEATLAENKQLKAEKLEGSFQAIGLDPTVGLGKAIAKEYDGEISTEALSAYAKEEYEWTTPDPGSEPSPLAQQVGQEQGKLDAVAASAGSVPVAPTTPETIAAAEAAGDWQTALTIKSQQVASDLFKPRR